MSILTTADLLSDALAKAGEKTDGTSDFLPTALNYMNTLYHSIVAGGNEFDVDCGEPWTWAKSKFPGTFVIQPKVSTFSVTMTANSANAIFTVAPAVSFQGYFLKVDNLPEYFRIVSHLAGQANFTIDVAYTDVTGTSSCDLCPIDYVLPAANVLRLIGPMNIHRTQTTDGDNEGKIVGLDQRSFEKKYPLQRLQQGIPVEFCVLASENGTVTVRMNKVSDITAKVEYHYIPVPAELTNDALSIPIIPDGHRQVLSYATAYAILVDKEDSKSDHFFQLTQRKLKGLVGANRKEFMQISKNRGRLIPRGDDFGVRNWPTSGNSN